jgi:hypothetical protein
MLNLIIILALSLTAVPRPITAEIQPCVWPKCEKPAVVAQIEPCIWPKCEKPEAMLAQIQPCVWPKCEKPTDSLGL